MSAIAEKQVMFVYNRNEKDADVEFDPNGYGWGTVMAAAYTFRPRMH